MEIDKIVKTVSLIRKKYKDRQQEQSISYLTLRRSSMSELRSSISEEIPKNSLELLQRYRTSRIKIPSYKLDAVELLCSILQRPIKRHFIALQILHKTGPSIKNILKSYESQSFDFSGKPKPRYEFDKENSHSINKLPRGQYRKRPPISNTLIDHRLASAIPVLENFLKKVSNHMIKIGFSIIFVIYSKENAANFIKNFLSKKILSSLKFPFIILKSLKTSYRRHSGSTVKGAIPPLNFKNKASVQDNYSIPDKSLKVFMNRLLNSRLLQENSYNSRSNSIGTDRTSEKHNPSTLPSSIYCESDNSITDRIDFQKKSILKSSIEMKDFDSYLEFDSFFNQKPQRPDSRKHFFKAKGEDKNQTHHLSFFKKKKKMLLLSDEYKPKVKLNIEKIHRALHKLLKRRLSKYAQRISKYILWNCKTHKISKLLAIYMRNSVALTFQRWSIAKKYYILGYRLQLILMQAKEAYEKRLLVLTFSLIFIKKSSIIAKSKQRIINRIHTYQKCTLLKVKSFYFAIIKNLYQNAAKSKVKLFNLFRHLTKDATYRTKVCFTYWKQEASYSYMDKLKRISLDQNIQNLIILRIGTVFNVFKLINKKYSTILSMKKIFLLKLVKRMRMKLEVSQRKAIIIWKNYKSTKQIQIIRKRVNKLYSILSKIDKSRKYEYYADIKIFSLGENSKKIHLISRFSKIMNNLSLQVQKSYFSKLISRINTYSTYVQKQRKNLKKLVRTKSLRISMKLQEIFFHWRLLVVKGCY